MGVCVRACLLAHVHVRAYFFALSLFALRFMRFGLEPLLFGFGLPDTHDRPHDQKLLGSSGRGCLRTFEASRVFGLSLFVLRFAFFRLAPLLFSVCLR